jgi:TRAP-type C4-dicarboxylate transport system permease small subunit
MNMNIVISLSRIVSSINRLMVLLGSLALVSASLVLSYSVISRGLFNEATDWQDEAAVFCLVGVTFLCASYVQEFRHHVGISAIASMLPAPIEKFRIFTIDLLSFVFCSFFTWKSWTLWHEAWSEGQVTSSSWAPPLSIPYGLMATGMTLLAFQLLLQTLQHFAAQPTKGA